MKKILKYKRIYLLALIPISYILVLVAKQSSFFAEQIYAKHIYKWLSQIISLITGIVPFSIAEILMIAIPIAVLILLIRFMAKVFLNKEGRSERIIKGILNLFCVLSVALFLFTILGGINYYRYSFSEYSNLEIQDSSVEELYALTQSLTDTANALRAQIPETDESGVFQLSMTQNELEKMAVKAYQVTAEDYPILSGYYGVPKPVLLSKQMSQTEIEGIFIPYTMEANVNIDIPDYNIPAAMLHEMAHQRGFMREDEANYIAYIVGMESDHVEFQYSSTMLALVTAGNALYDQDPDLYFDIVGQYSEGVKKDLRANSDYWSQFDNQTVSAISNKINDTYLKVNNQTDGVKSYGRMLDLLLAKYKKDHEIE